MGNDKHLELLKQGKDEWNSWKDSNPDVSPDFSNSNLDGLDLSYYHLDKTNFYEASLRGCNFNNAWLSWIIFIRADLSDSTILNPDFEVYTESNSLMGVNVRWSAFAEANLRNVKMKGATLEGAHFHNCNLIGADISYSRIHGISCWGNELDETTNQSNLIITEWGEPLVTADNLEIAQFLYLLISNKKIRDAIDTLATKVVLILGSFAPKDKIILDKIKQELHQQNLVPIMYDFEKPMSRNHTETVTTLALLSRFIIADLSNQRSVPHELATLIPQLRTIPVVPIIRADQKPYGMFADFANLKNVTSLVRYSASTSMRELVDQIIKAANKI